MIEPTNRVPVPGSLRRPAANATPAQPPSGAADRIEATLVLRRRAAESVETPAGPLSSEEFALRLGGDPADAQRVREVLEPLGVEVLSSDPVRRLVRVAGSVETMQRVFGTSLEWVTSEGPTGQAAHWHRSGELSVPTELDGIVTAVLGLDGRPQARAHFRSIAARASATSYTPPQLGTIYGFPEGTDGSGRTVAIVELGGGYEQSDLETYFKGLGIAAPTVTAVGVDGADNVPGGDPDGADGEVMLDVEVVGALAPAADIVVYFAPNTDAGFVDAVSQAAHASPTPVAISISWGQSEDQWTEQARTALDEALVDAVALGATVTVAAGDSGSSDGEGDGAAHVDFPASSPHALACGGTSLVADPTTGVIERETVWNDGTQGGATGGGVSDAFALPSWQAGAGVPDAAGGSASGRGVPDVAAVADPETGYRVRVDGTDTVIGGTSAVAPLWAALIARLAQKTDRPLGLVQTVLYRGAQAGRAATGFRDVTSGDNGAYSAAAGWDPCTGLGSPDGTALLAALTAAS